MKTIALIAQKGGVGKTTLAVHLAVAAERAGKSAVIVDLDPQASSAMWKDLRQAETPAVVSAQATRLQPVLKAAAENGADFAFIDTAPHSESAALTASRQSDAVIIPCRPGILDLKAISTTIDLVKLAGKRAAVVLTAVPPRGSVGDEAAAALEQYEVDLSPARIYHRAAYYHSLTDGRTAQEYEPNGVAAEEVAHLYKWVCKHVKM